MRIFQLFKFWFDFRLSYSNIYSLINRLIFDIFQDIFINFRFLPKLDLVSLNQKNKMVSQ